MSVGEEGGVVLLNLEGVMFVLNGRGDVVRKISIADLIWADGLYCSDVQFPIFSLFPDYYDFTICKVLVVWQTHLEALSLRHRLLAEIPHRNDAISWDRPLKLIDIDVASLEISILELTNLYLGFLLTNLDIKGRKRWNIWIGVHW